MASSTTSTTVDLSRLPAPTVVEQLSFETIFDEMVARLQELLPSFDATVDSDPGVKVLQVAAYREVLLRQSFNDRARQVMTAYANGSNLDHLAVLVGVFRLTLDPGDDALGINPVYEPDEALRERIVLAPESFSVAGPELAYIFHARSADATILDASATSPVPGEVLVTILSSLGDGTASADQIEAVEEVLGVEFGNRIRPLGDLVTIASAQIVPFVIKAELTVKAGPDQTLILAASQAATAAWVERSGRLGADAVRAAIMNALFVEGVQNVKLISPAADVVVNRTQSAHCVGISVSVTGVAD